MDARTNVLICLGAAVSSNCVACFRYYHGEARRLGVDPAEIDAAVRLAAKVKAGANIAVMGAVAEASGGAGSDGGACDEAVPSSSSCCSRGR